MRLMQRLAGLLVLFALSAALLLCGNAATGQTNENPMGAGLQMLQGLSPEQRESISQQLGGGGLGNTGTTPGAVGARALPMNEEQQNLMLQQQRDLLMDQLKQRAELQRLSPFLKAEDWVVITIDSNPLPAGPPVPTGPPQGAAALSGAQWARRWCSSGLPAAAEHSRQSGSGSCGESGCWRSIRRSGSAAAQGGAAATAAGMTPSPPQYATAGGYAPLPPDCTGQPNCDTSQTHQAAADR